jgi:hypothetical protein
MSVQREPVPDLLRRFTPTPYSADVAFAGIPLALQTNDPQIITEMQRGSSEEIITLEFDGPVLVRVVRDDDAPDDSSGIMVLSAWPLVTLLVGTGTTLALDCERREILGFLSSSVSAERFARELIPILLKRFRNQALDDGRGQARTTV